MSGSRLISSRNFGSGLRSNLLGHGFEPVVRAARRWMGEGVNFVRPHRLEMEAAERLADLIPSAEMVKFGLNGSDATTAAVRLARAYTGRDLVAVRVVEDLDQPEGGQKDGQAEVQGPGHRTDAPLAVQDERRDDDIEGNG